MNKVIVVGSVNMDITARTDKLPDTGETVAARSVEYLPGGKVKIPGLENGMIPKAEKA